MSSGEPSATHHLGGLIHKPTTCFEPLTADQSALDLINCPTIPLRTDVGQMCVRLSRCNGGEDVGAIDEAIC